VQRSYLEVAWLEEKQTDKQAYKQTNMQACMHVDPFRWPGSMPPPSPPLSLGGSSFFGSQQREGEGDPG